MIDYFKSIENAVDFIETNLCQRFTIEDVSNKAFQSRWHFQRVFRLVTGFSVYDYVKKRRLAEAGSELLLNKTKIIDLALKYQYGSPEAFTRAFQKEYRKAPSDFRSSIDEHRIFSRIDMDQNKSTKTYAKGHISYEPVTRKATTFVGKKYRTSMKNHQNEKDVPQAWAEFSKLKLGDKLISKSLFPGNYGLYYEWDYDENFSLLLGCQVESEKKATDFIASTTDNRFHFYSVNPCKYMVFTIPGREKEDILAGWNYIYGNWMPNTGFERDYSEDFDFFDDRFYSEDPVSEIYIPIK